jgi:hypothetical protein
LGGFAVVFGAVGVGARAVGASRGGIGSSFFSGLNKFLYIPMLQSCIVVGFYLCSLLIVGLLGVFEDVDKMFTLEESVELGDRGTENLQC